MLEPYFLVMKERNSHMKSIKLNIEGLEEKETQDKVRDQLVGLRGVKEVGISTDESFVDVIYDDQTSDAEISNHLQNNGYKIK